MWLLVTYITIWAISPGPVCIKTIQETRSHGTKAGVIISMGASITAVLMVISGLIIHNLGFSALFESSGVFVIEQIGAIGIILMGVYAIYKCFTADLEELALEGEMTSSKAGIFQGMGVMAAGIPQALFFYNVMIPQAVELSAVTGTIIALGALKVAMIFVAHSVVAMITNRSQRIAPNNRFKKLFDFSLAGMLIAMGVSILF